MQLSTELESCLREFSSAGPAELRENGARVAPLSTLSWEVRGNSEKPLLHLWSENHNLTRRVLAITDHSEQRLVLAVECFGRIKPDRLEFLRIEFDRSERDLSQQAFSQEIRRLCEHQFPDDSLDSLTSAADLKSVPQIAIELYAPLPGGLAVGGRFAPSTVRVPGMVEVRRVRCGLVRRCVLRACVLGASNLFSFLKPGIT